MALTTAKDVYRGAFERVILPALEEYAPDLVIISAGFDASARDPLAEMALSADAFGWMARELRQVADRSAEGRVLLALEGGYDLRALGRSVVLKVLSPDLASGLSAERFGTPERPTIGHAAPR
jgi:acetoin utilization deacetylase AcuC-like enzyme